MSMKLSSESMSETAPVGPSVCDTRAATFIRRAKEQFGALVRLLRRAGVIPRTVECNIALSVSLGHSWHTSVIHSIPGIPDGAPSPGSRTSSDCGSTPITPMPLASSPSWFVPDPLPAYDSPPMPRRRRRRVCEHVDSPVDWRPVPMGWWHMGVAASLRATPRRSAPY